MRAFIALEISDQIKDALARVEAHLKYSDADVKWMKPETVHLTLKFLGEIGDKDRDAVKASLDAIAGSVKPFGLALKDIGAFPKIERPRVIWIGLGAGAIESTELAARIEDSLSGLGFAKGDRPFSPHLTIGRARSMHNVDKLKDKISSASSILREEADIFYKVTSVVLFRSTLTPQGAIHTKLHEARFAG